MVIRKMDSGEPGSEGRRGYEFESTEGFVEFCERGRRMLTPYTSTADALPPELQQQAVSMIAKLEQNKTMAGAVTLEERKDLMRRYGLLITQILIPRLRK